LRITHHEVTHMPLDIWFREDIKHILMAAEQASALSLAQAAEGLADPGTLQAYHRGYQAALTAVALACGITPHTDGKAPRQRRRQEGDEW